MADTATVPFGRKTQREPAVKEVHILWTPDGMSCDGDTVSVTAATQPSIEDIIMGTIPGLPKVHLHNRVLDYSQGGAEYMETWFAAAEGRLDAPFILVVEGSIPNEEIKSEGYWAAIGADPQTGQPITLNTWIDRPAQGLCRRCRRHLRHLWRHPRDGRQSDRLDGPGRLPWLELALENHPYPPTPWNASPRDIYGTPGPYEDAVQNTPIFEENGPENFKGVDIMGAVRSFDPCLPCGVHMFLGK